VESRSLVLYGTTPETAGAISSLAAELGLRVGAAANGTTPASDVALVSVERDADAGFRLAASLARAGTRVVVHGPAKDADLSLRALRAGAQEFVVAGDAEGLRRALGNRGVAEVRGRVVAVYPAKGGQGATTIATNLAGALQRRGVRACIADLDAALGAVTSVLDVAPQYSLHDVVANMHRLDRELLDASIPRHGSGVAVVAAGDDVEAAERVDPATISSLLGFLRRHYDAIVVDGVRGFDERTLGALDASDEVLLVLTQEVAAVRNAQRCLDVFRRLGYPAEKVQVVLNRFQKGSTITADIVEETLQVPATARVANDFAAVSRAASSGALLADDAPRSAATRDIEALAQRTGIAGGSEERPASWLGRVLGRKAAHGAP
jgi:pilus assembly protein CpaE